MRDRRSDGASIERDPPDNGQMKYLPQQAAESRGVWRAHRSDVLFLLYLLGGLAVCGILIAIIVVSFWSVGLIEL